MTLGFLFRGALCWEDQVCVIVGGADVDLSPVGGGGGGGGADPRKGCYNADVSLCISRPTHIW